MGMEDVDEKITVQIGENVEYLNEEFEGMIKFQLNLLFLDNNHSYIPDLHRSFVNQEGEVIEALVRPLEKKGSINVYLFETYLEEGTDAAMMGFTPVLRRGANSYQYNSPKFDRMFIAYPGLLNKSTLVHEMGHFLGLQHPWEMSEIDRELMGLCTCDRTNTNHMTYNSLVDNFTEEQLTRMQHFALQFRQYLLSHIELVYRSP